MADPEIVSDEAEAQLDRLRFLHRVARLATTARTWDELLETVVDGTRDALQADVSSLYLLDRDGAYLTLAATNGLDRFQIGRARVPFGEGVTGRVAATPRAARHPGRRQRPAVPVGPRHRPASLRRLDAVRAARAGTTDRRRAQRPDRADPRLHAADVAQLRAIADLLAGIVEKGRQQREAEARAAELIAIDEARAELIALVTHELRTPLAVVRAYADLLGRRPAARRPRVARPGTTGPAREPGIDGSVEPGRAAGSPRRLDPGLASGSCPTSRPSVEPVDVARSRSTRSCELEPLLGRHRVSRRPASASTPWPTRRGSARSLEHLIENAVKYAPPGDGHHRSTGQLVEGVVRLGVSRRGTGHPRGVARADLRALRPARHAYGPRLGHRALRRQAPRRIDGCAALVRAGRPTGGARFVVALPAAVGRLA